MFDNDFKNISSIFNTWNINLSVKKIETLFRIAIKYIEILKILKTILKITIKYTLNLTTENDKIKVDDIECVWPCLKYHF